MTNSEKRALAVALLLLLASFAAFVHPWYLRNADAAMYIATARSLAEGEGYRYLGERFWVRPPGFSLLLAPLLVLRGGSDFLWMNGLVAATGALGAIALYGLARARLGWPLALVTAAALWLNPGYQRLCTSILSDVPGGAAALGCLWWVSRALSSDVRSDWGLGLAIGFAVWLRSANLLLVPAVVLARWLASDAREGRVRSALLGAPLVAVVVAAPWFVYAQWNASDLPADQTRLASYATAMLHEDPGDPTSRRLALAEIAGRAPQRAVQLLAVLGSRLGTTVKGAGHDPLDASGELRAPAGVTPSQPAAVLQLALGGFLLAALVRELRVTRAAAEWFALGNVAVLLFYFGFQDRLALPVYAIALVAGVAWLRDLASRVLPVRRATLVAGGLVVLVAAIDFEPRAGWRAIEAEHARLAAASEAAAPMLAPGSRVAAWRGFHHSVFLERPVFSLHRSVGRLGAEAGIEAVIERHDVDTIFLTTGGLAHVRGHLRARYGEPERAGGAEVWQLGR